MAMYRLGSAQLIEANVSTEQWTKKVCCGKKTCSCGDGCRVKVARTVIAKYSPEKYMLSHVSIMAAVDTELADKDNPKSNYYIIPEYSKFVNNNGDAWTKEVLTNTYKTFIGADNFVEHVQLSSLSKGKVVDAVLREVSIGKDRDGKDLSTFYVDLLVATDRKHKDLIRSIEAGEMNSLSMGCKIAFSICSKCGNKAVDETEACDHVKFEKNSFFYDDNGAKRKVAELCGSKDDADSVTFIDASWVKSPAFTGAVIRNIVIPPENIKAKIEEANKKESFQAKDTDYLKAAAKEDEKTAPDEDLPENSEDKPDEAAPDDKSEEATPIDDTSETDTPELPEEPKEEDIKSWKSKIKQRILKEVSDDIAKELSGEPEDGTPRELETLDENLIQPSASLKQMWKMKKGWDKILQKTAGNLNKDKFERLKFGTYMLLNSSDMTVLSNYGYNKRDFLAVMSCLDKCFNNPLPIEIKKAVAELNGTKGLTFGKAVFALQKLVGRKMSADELKKSITWLKLMDSYSEF